MLVRGGLSRSFATRDYACSTVRDRRRKKVHRRSDECSVRASPRFPNVNLYSVKKEKREDCWREGDPGEKGGRRGVARQCSGIKSHKTRGKPPRASGTQKLIMDTMVDGSISAGRRRYSFDRTFQKIMSDWMFASFPPFGSATRFVRRYCSCFLSRRSAGELGQRFGAIRGVRVWDVDSSGGSSWRSFGEFFVERRGCSRRSV